MGRHTPYRHGSVLALDRNFIPMSEISRKHSIKAICSGRAQAIDLTTYERFDGREACKRQIYAIIYTEVQAVAEVKLAVGKGNTGVLRRDKHRCAYCGKHANTVDHIIPRCQGGQTSWMNLCASCFECNQKKGGRTPEQAGMVLLKKPTSPRALLYEHFHNLVAGKRELEEAI